MIWTVVISAGVSVVKRNVLYAYVLADLLLEKKIMVDFGYDHDRCHTNSERD